MQRGLMLLTDLRMASPEEMLAQWNRAAVTYLGGEADALYTGLLALHRAAAAERRQEEHY
eukprot:2058692-Amphidinium_carterae.1